MIWGYRFSEIEDHLRLLGFMRVRETDLTVIYRQADRIFTIRRPNAHGSLPEPTVPMHSTRRGWSHPSQRLATSIDKDGRASPGRHDMERQLQLESSPPPKSPPSSNEASWKDASLPPPPAPLWSQDALLKEAS